MGNRTRTLKIPCKAPGCIKPKEKRGWCSRHYQQMYHYGHLLAPKDHQTTFWSHVAVAGPDDCWPWKIGLFREGYGMASIPGGTARAHRVAYEYAVGPIPAGKILDHICHNPKLCAGGPTCEHRKCCNPQHLKPVTHVENSSPERAAMNRGLRVTSCPRGHEYTPDNTRTDVRGGRHCRQCERARWQKN